MEQAVNTFQEGLQTDVHPMTQGTNVLSDALNATFITMNGNEVVLQNDMGNRRVDNAFLPAGYQPVGIKEYGGVIYVASYNPITNRSQIGSFPSPERKRGTEYSDLQGVLNFDKLQEYDVENNIKFLKNDTILVKLTGDTSLHAGDKFSVYCNYANLPTSNITNFNNTSGNKVLSPKNKLYTLSLGILNSQNEFVDITKTLQRWNSNNQIITFNDNISDLYKFNSGYFIAPSRPSGVNYDDLTKNDRQLLEERQKIAINTYAYKLVGPLYLKATLNHIENASYNIYGIKEGNIITLWIESVITYNCPDGLTSGRGSDDNYSTYALGTPTFKGFDFKGLNVTLNLNSTEYKNHSYDSKTNLYTVTITKKYTCSNPSSNIIEYYFCVPGINDLYLKGLSEKGSIDTTLLGSGQIDLMGWRFYNNSKEEGETILTYNLSAYPKYGSSFKDLQFKFTNVDNPSNLVTLKESDGLTIFNGKNNIQFNWKDKGFIKRSLYEVEISYQESGLNNRTVLDSKKWFLTTELFNNCYRPSHSDYMADFTSEEKEGIRKQYCTVNTEVNYFTKNLSPDKVVTDNGGKLLSQSQDINIVYTHTQDIDLQLTTSVNIKNEELYPSYLTINTYPTYTAQGKADIDLVQSEIDFKEDPIDDMVHIKNSQDGTLNTNYNNDIINISGTVEYYDKYHSVGKAASNMSIENGFTTISDAIEKIVEQTTDYTGIYLDMESHYGGDKHYVVAVANDQNMFDHRASNDGATLDRDVQCIYYEHDDGMKAVSLSDGSNYSTAMKKFNETNQKNVFIWLGIGRGLGQGSKSDHAFMSNQRMLYHDDDPTAKQNPYARIWWKTANLDYPWALLEIPWTNVPSERVDRTELIKVIKRHFVNPDNIYICFYKEYPLQGFYIPNINNENYNYEYNLDLPIKIEMKENDKATLNNKTNAPLTFIVSEGKQTQILDINDIKLKSDKTFQSIVENSSNISTNGVVVSTGLGLDYNRDPLDINSVYVKKEDGTLQKSVNSKIVPHSTTYGGQYYGFLYSKNYTPGTPDSSKSYVYDTYGDDGDSFTSLSYASVNMVKDNSING